MLADIALILAPFAAGFATYGMCELADRVVGARRRAKREQVVALHQVKSDPHGLALARAQAERNTAQRALDTLKVALCACCGDPVCVDLDCSLYDDDAQCPRGACAHAQKVKGRWVCCAECGDMSAGGGA